MTLSYMDKCRNKYIKTNLLYEIKCMSFETNIGLVIMIISKTNEVRQGY